jgi:transglutaminase-like putative cysteine protease
MRYFIQHQTTYTYDAPVELAPHTIRLRPRSDAYQTLHHCTFDLQPAALQTSATVDLDGNSILRVWFADTKTTTLQITVTSEVETWCTNPFNFLLEPWAVRCPMDYPHGLEQRLQPYLGGYLLERPGVVDPVAHQLAQEIWQTVEGNTSQFLTTLNQRIYTHAQYQVRETGVPLPPGLTWQTQTGSCRDVTVLFMEVCRAVGLAARFVSGYQEGDPDTTDRHLHAWAEVYLPGAGWRGYDPTHGLAVADRHIALVASPHPRDAAPIAGSLKNAGAIASRMDYHLTLKDISGG